ncbi:MAG: thiamine phosphate synthase [Parasphingopyxis sp.]|nr:thiamine phosphate synthase [Sphingomonadales bacterium]
MSDERQGEALWPALDNLPAGSGVVVRHYSLARAERRTLIDRVREIARPRGLVLIVAGPPDLATACGADGFHERSERIGPPELLRTMSAHDAAEIETAERVGADLVFVSPVFATRSHTEAPALGRAKFTSLVGQTDLPVVALGGMDAERAHSLAGTGMHGWAAIGALTPTN